jgi:hypothetical protein
VSPLFTVVVVTVFVSVWMPTIVLLRRDGVDRSTRRSRAALTLAVSVTAAALAWTVWSRPQPGLSDVAPQWAGARALAHGHNPYDAVGPGRAFDTTFPLVYPMTTVVMMVPLAVLPLRWVDPIVVGLGFALLTWAVTRRRIATPAIVALVSLAALMTLQTSQWSMLLTGAALVPALGFLLVAKPTIGFALFAACPEWKTIAGCAILLMATFAIAPGWIADWRTGLAAVPHVVAPIVRPGGALVLLAALRWKRPEARLLVALACVPHTTAAYETIPLFLIPQTWLEAWTLWALSLVAYAAQWASGPYTTPAAYWASGAQWIVVFMYLPCAVMVLRRPNVWCTLTGEPAPIPLLPLRQRAQSGGAMPSGRPTVRVGS